MEENFEDGLALFWMDFLEVMKLFTAGLTTEWPPELLPDSQSSTEDFWMGACREEMRTRTAISEKIRWLIEMKENPSFEVLESWLFRRRVEWASQVAMDRFEKKILPNASLQDVALWALTESWENDGCQGMWLHAERGGKLHPEAPDYLRDLQ